MPRLKVAGIVPIMMVALAAWWALLFLYMTVSIRAHADAQRAASEFRRRGWLP